MMIQAMKDLQKDEAQKAIQKKIDAKKQLDEIYLANKKAILIKK